MTSTPSETHKSPERILISDLLLLILLSFENKVFALRQKFMTKSHKFSERLLIIDFVQDNVEENL